MKKAMYGVVALVAAVLLAGCGAKLPPLSAVPVAVDAANQDVRAGAAKAVGILTSAARLANTISSIEDQAAREGVIPAAADRAFDAAMLAYTDASDRAVLAASSGALKSWDELRALVDPVLAEVQRLSDLARSFGEIRSRLGDWLQALRDIGGGLSQMFDPAGGVR